MIRSIRLKTFWTITIGMAVLMAGSYFAGRLLQQAQLPQLPGPAVVQAAAEESVQCADHFVTVRKGDTLSRIAKDELHRASFYPLLAELNDIENPDLIYVDQKISVSCDPASAVRVLRAQRTLPTENPTARAEQAVPVTDAAAETQVEPAAAQTGTPQEEQTEALPLLRADVPSLLFIAAPIALAPESAEDRSDESAEELPMQPVETPTTFVGPGMYEIACDPRRAGGKKTGKLPAFYLENKKDGVWQTALGTSVVIRKAGGTQGFLCEFPLESKPGQDARLVFEISKGRLAGFESDNLNQALRIRPLRKHNRLVGALKYAARYAAPVAISAVSLMYGNPMPLAGLSTRSIQSMVAEKNQRNQERLGAKQEELRRAMGESQASQPQ